jgi:hypothetical protein
MIETAEELRSELIDAVMCIDDAHREGEAPAATLYARVIAAHNAIIAAEARYRVPVIV